MENKDSLTLVPTDNKTFNSLVTYMPEHKQMLEVIKTNLPEINRSTSLFNKTQSQWMDNMLTVSHPTPIRNLRQILAEINKTNAALKEAYFNCSRKEVNIRIKQRELEEEKDELKRELISIDIAEYCSQLDNARGLISGAVRILANYVEQYNAILQTHSLQDFNEEEFEKEEERYHIMKAFDQALCAARSNGGRVDEGNHIYFSQIGVNGAAAQLYVENFMANEKKLISENIEPPHQLQLNFLNDMANHFQGHSAKFAQHKGMKSTMSNVALIKNPTKE